MCKDSDCIRFFSTSRIEEFNRNFQYVTGRLDKTLERLDSGTGAPNKESTVFEIRAKIRKRQEDREKSILVMCDNVVSEAHYLKKCTVGEYLIKLDNFVTSIEAASGSKNDMLKNTSLLKK